MTPAPRVDRERVRRSLAQQEEYRMRDGDAGSREPGTAAGRRLLGLGTLVIPPDGQWSPGLADEILAIEAEARQQGRDRADRIELAARAVITRAAVVGYTSQARLDALMTLRWALASADGPPEPQDSGLDEFGNPAGFMATEPGIDVERLGVAMHRNAAASYRAPKRQQDALADRSAAESWREYAKRVVAEYDRLRADSRPEQPTPQDVDAARLQGAAEASREILDLLLPSELARVNAILNPAPRAVRPEEPPE